jgi:predicted DNA-binding protein
MSTKRASKTLKINTLLTLEKELENKISQAAKETGLSKQAVMRLSIERGLNVLVAQLSRNPAA